LQVHKSEYRQKSYRRWYLLAIFTCTIILIPFFYISKHITIEDYVTVFRIISNNKKIVIFGNSVNKHYSKCDNDKSGIGEMLERYSDMSVLDVSKGGLSLAEFKDMNKVVLTYSKPDFIVIPVEPNSDFKMSEFSNEIALKGIFYSVVSFKGIDNYPVWSVPMRKWITDTIWPVESNSNSGDMKGNITLFKRNYYPKSSEKLMKKFFVDEKDSMVCPEGNGKDLNFIEYNYWKIYFENGYVDNLDRLISMVSDIRTTKSVPIVCIYPVDIELIKDISDPEVYELIYLNVKKIKSILRDNRIDYLDLSHSLDNSRFTDRWCACGHLNQNGRSFVAYAIAEKIKSIVERPTRALR
jgi:hypothetical protein